MSPTWCGIIPADTYRSTIDQIHTRVVQESVASQSANRVLGTPAPRINKLESSLSHPTCAVLAQLRSGHCSRLQDYQYRINKVNSDVCTKCQTGPDSVSHLFDCPAPSSSAKTAETASCGAASFSLSPPIWAPSASPSFRSTGGGSLKTLFLEIGFYRWL